MTPHEGPAGAASYGAPTSAAPYHGPASATPYGGPTSAPPYGAPTTGSPYGRPTSASPYSHPTSGTPYDGPISATPYDQPTSGTPQNHPTSGTPSDSSYGPFNNAPDRGPFNNDPDSGPFNNAPDRGPYDSDPDRGRFTSDPITNDPDPYGFSAPHGRRIEPSPPPQRSRFLMGLLAGLTAGLLVFGSAAWFTARATAPKPVAAPAPTPTPTASAPGIFEQNQVAINTPDFAGTALGPFVQGWLPYVATCSRNGTPGGPTLNAGEKFRVRCTLDGMSAIFVEYKSIAERDKARVKTLSQAVDARTLAPGVADAVTKSSASGRTTGNYVEYAYRLTERGTTRTVSGLWWDDAQTPVAGYLLGYWKEGLGGKWDPMRDLWSRYA